MATLDDALAVSGLELYELPEWEPRLAIRQLWVAASFWKWFDETEELHDPANKSGGRTPAEHIQQLFCDIRCSERPGAGDLKRMMPTKKGVWKLHPAKSRLYGWAPRAECIAVIAGALEAETKDKAKGDLNNQKRDEVLAFIKSRKLQEHVFLGDILAVFPPKTESSTPNVLEVVRPNRRTVTRSLREKE